MALDLSVMVLQQPGRLTVQRSLNESCILYTINLASLTLFSFPLSLLFTLLYSLKTGSRCVSIVAKWETSWPIDIDLFTRRFCSALL